MDRIQASIDTCRLAAESFEVALTQALAGGEPISEFGLCESWLHYVHQHSSIYPDGWYTPPPHGMFIQFATDTQPERINQTNNRLAGAWPRSDIFLDREHGLISAYASPVDRASGMIGDFGITLYFGTNSDIQSVLKQTLDIDIALYEKLRVGMSYSAIYEQCAALLKEAGSYNAIASLNDPAGTNIGHTIPAADSDWSEAERRVFSSGDWPAICSLIGKKRLFINELEHTPIAATGAFTIEPRPLVNNRPDLPMVSLHTMVLWRKGQKQLVTFFERLFRLAGMDYMFDAVTSPVLATSSRFSQRLI